MKRVLVVTFVTLMLFSCSNEDKKSGVTIDTDTTKKDDGKVEPPDTVLLTGYLYQLKLDSAHYGNLKGMAPNKAKKLFLQFLFDDARADYPTLVAYATKNKEYVRHRDSVILTPLGQSFQLPARKYIGTQQVEIKAIEDLLDAIFTTNPKRWHHLRFTPQIDNRGHIIYIITVWCTATTPCPVPATGDVPTNPSPPKDAS